MYTLITGASSGIGKELAFLHAKDGYDLILVARNQDALGKISNELKSYNINVIIKPYDLSDINNAYKLFDEIKNLELVRLINNAGYGNVGLFQSANLDLELNMIDLNIRTLHILTKLYIQHFDKGEVVNISSAAAFLPTPSLATYASTKSYVYQLSRAVNYELRKSGSDIRVLSVTPGPVKTNFNARANASISRGMDVVKCAKIIYKGIKKRKALIIPGGLIKIAYFFTRVMPVSLLLRAAYRIQRSK